MSSIQNKQVMSKFLSERSNADSKSSNPTNLTERSSIPQSPQKSIEETSSKSRLAPQFKGSLRENISSRLRAAAATLPRTIQTCNTLCRDIHRPKNFDYHLSVEETHCFNDCNKPMKSVPAAELQIIQSGQRATYLETRYKHIPRTKYNYPEATYWRYGWVHPHYAPK